MAYQLWVSVVHLVPLILLSLAQVVAGLALSARFLPGRSQYLDRAVAAVLLGAVLPLAEVTLLSSINALHRQPLLLLASTLPFALVLTVGSVARACVLDDMHRALNALRGVLRVPSQTFALCPALCAIFIVVIAAGCLEVWSWDSLGYHLPVVFDAIDSGGFREIPSHIPYVNVYPRGGERLFAFARLLLPDDGWIDLAQLPGALGAVVITTALARRAGARFGLALACASLWLTVPAVALQIPTNYVDIYFACWLLAVAYFVTGPLDARRATLVGISLAMLLACKAVALVPALICGLVFATRALWHRRPGLALIAAATASMGTLTYISNVFRYGNPVWPVEVRLGPFRFPGLDPVGPMYVQGLEKGVAYLPAPIRFVLSLLSEPSHYLYDMRMGGFGPVVQLLVVSLPLVLAVLIWKSWSADRLVNVVAQLKRNATRWLGPIVVVVSTMFLPMAHWPRFSLAIPAALFVGAACVLDRATSRMRALGLSSLAVVSLLGLGRALPGFTGGDGTSVFSLPAASFESRLTATSIDGAPQLWHSLKTTLAPGQAIAYDHGFELPGLLWRRDGATRVAYLDWNSPPTSLVDWLVSNRVRALVLGRDEPARTAIASLGSHLQLRAACPSGPCDVYDVSFAAGTLTLPRKEASAFDPGFVLSSPP